jgi:hypothetical protein
MEAWLYQVGDCVQPHRIVCRRELPSPMVRLERVQALFDKSVSSIFGNLILHTETLLFASEHVVHSSAASVDLPNHM